MAEKRKKLAEKDQKKKKKQLALLVTGNQAGKIGGGHGA